jgi:hypothetical protein
MTLSGPEFQLRVSTHPFLSGRDYGYSDALWETDLQHFDPTSSFVRIGPSPPPPPLPVLEPAAWSLLILGFGAAGALLRRQKGYTGRETQFFDSAPAQSLAERRQPRMS